MAPIREDGLGKFQSDVLRALAAQRSPDYDSETRLEAAATADAAVLTAAGYTVTWGRISEGKRDAAVSRRGEAMPLEWVTDAAFRFFPTQPDELFGYVLHPVDLATNKASAAADGRVRAILSIW